MYTSEHDDCPLNIPHHHPPTDHELAYGDEHDENCKLCGIIDTPSTFDELLSAILKILPDAQLGEDNDGQLIIYTNKVMVQALTGELTNDIVDMPDQSHLEHESDCQHK
jgi:hypothetical protein